MMWIPPDEISAGLFDGLRLLPAGAPTPVVSLEGAVLFLSLSIEYLLLYGFFDGEV